LRHNASPPARLARLAALKKLPLRLRLAGAAVAGLAATLAPSATQNAVANGDTRTLSFYHVHTRETIRITYLSGGSYVSSATSQLNQFLRDWRNDQQTRMDPRLYDILWEVQRAAGSSAPIKVLSAYRSPSTNAMLRRSSRGVAEHSQHTRGKAIDIHLDDVGLSRIREAGMRLQKGGVGYYPSASFVHLDTGSVRHWPRMSYDQLARLFPDGKTVHVPANGQPLPGYDQALAMIQAGGGSAYGSDYVTSQKSKGLFAFLFGGGEDDASEIQEATGRGGRGRGGGRSNETHMAYAGGEDSGSKSFFSGLFGGRSQEQTQVAALDPRAARRAAAEARAQERADARRKADEAKAEARKQAEEAKRQSEEARRQADEQKKQVDDARKQADDAKREIEIARLETKRQTDEARAEARRLSDEAARLAAARGKAEEPKDAALEAKLVQEARLDAARLKLEERLASAPTPPRRPSESMLASLSFADVPLPPSRPVGLVAGAPTLAGKKLSSLEDGALPALIIEGAGQPAIGGSAMAYAPEPVRRPAPPALVRAEIPLDARKPAQANLTPPRIDRATFRALTAETPNAKAASRATLAPTVTPLRAARGAARLGDEGGVATTFGASPTGDLSASAFSGKAVATLPRASQFGDLPLRLKAQDEAKATD
jgi:uncharacterized protein YcbK (DUF882 family)